MARRYVAVLTLSVLTVSFLALHEIHASMLFSRQPAVSAKKVVSLIIQSPAVISDRDVGFVTSRLIHSADYPGYLEKSLQVSEYEVEGLQETFGMQLFGVKLDSHLDELVVYHHGKLVGLKISFELERIKKIAFENKKLVIEFQDGVRKGYITVAISGNKRLSIDRK